MFVSRLVQLFVLIVYVGLFGGGGGWEYLFSVSKYLRDSCINLFGRKGNLLWITSGGLLRLDNLLISMLVHSMLK
jgi:hypothetical protein